jgi:cell division protein FtsN
MPQLVKVIPAQVYYPSVAVPVVTAPAYCPPVTPIPVITAPIRKVQVQCPPDYPSYTVPVYTVPAPQAYRQIQPQPSYTYKQPQYVQPQQQYVQPQPQQQYVQPQQAAPQVQVYTSPPQTTQPPVTVYTAPTQSSPVTVYTAPSQPQAPAYGTGMAVIKPNMPDPSSAGVYRVQVGSYVDPQNAQVVAEALARAGLSPAYEQYGQNWRVVLPGISAHQLTSIAQCLGAIGIREAWIRLEG